MRKLECGLRYLAYLLGGDSFSTFFDELLPKLFKKKDTSVLPRLQRYLEGSFDRPAHFAFRTETEPVTLDLSFFNGAGVRIVRVPGGNYQMEPYFEKGGNFAQLAAQGGAARKGLELMLSRAKSIAESLDSPGPPELLAAIAVAIEAEKTTK